MAGVGHITVFGLSDYAATFRKTNPTLNKLLTDSIRTSNQYLVALSALISSFTYWRMGRLVLPLGLCLAIGGLLAGYLVPLLTVGKQRWAPIPAFSGWRSSRWPLCSSTRPPQGHGGPQGRPGCSQGL